MSDEPETPTTGRAEDRFDRISKPTRVGAHRVTVRPRYVWHYLIAAVLGVAILTTAGVIVLNISGAQGRFSSEGKDTGSSETAEKKVVGKIDADATVAVLNGTTTSNLAAAVDHQITKNKWGTMVFSGSAAKSDENISAVFYSKKSDAVAAAGLAEKLGGMSTYVSKDYADYDARLIVLLGSDYAGPGLDEAKKMTSSAGSDENADGTGADDSADAADGAADDSSAGASDDSSGQ